MARRHFWHVPREGWQHGLFLAALALAMLNALVGAGRTPTGGALMVALAVVLAGWYVYWFVWPGGERHDARGASVPYLIGAAVLWAVMTAVDPSMLLVGLAVLVPYCLRYPLWCAAGTVALAASWLAYRFVSGDLEVLTVLVCVLGAVVAVAIAGYIATLEREGRKRQRLLDELAAAQAELAVTERRTGILAERTRLARDIHDTLTQGFTSIAMLLDAELADKPPDGPATARVEQAMQIARENLVESRRLVHALRPPRLDGTHLADAIRALTDRLGEETDIYASTVVTGEPVALSSDADAQLLRVVQEALTNVRRHAKATEAIVTLSYVEDVLAIDINDNGSGFPVRSSDAAAPSEGLGLGTMRERVASLGGTLIVESRPGEGTTVAVSIPLVSQAYSSPVIEADEKGDGPPTRSVEERLGRS